MSLDDYATHLLLAGTKCPKCREGILQTTPLTLPDEGDAIGCNRCSFPTQSEPTSPKRITQALIDNAFAYLDGHGRLTYALEGCKIIQSVLRDTYGVQLSLNECRRFWEWRSEQFDASFLTVEKHERGCEEILKYFVEWLDSLDMWEWSDEDESL